MRFAELFGQFQRLSQRMASPIGRNPISMLRSPWRGLEGWGGCAFQAWWHEIVSDAQTLSRPYVVVVVSRRPITFTTHVSIPEHIRLAPSGRHTCASTHVAWPFLTQTPTPSLRTCSSKPKKASKGPKKSRSPTSSPGSKASPSESSKKQRARDERQPKHSHAAPSASQKDAKVHSHDTSRKQFPPGYIPPTYTPAFQAPTTQRQGAAKSTPSESPSSMPASSRSPAKAPATSAAAAAPDKAASLDEGNANASGARQSTVQTAEAIGTAHAGKAPSTPEAKQAGSAPTKPRKALKTAKRDEAVQSALDALTRRISDKFWSVLASILSFWRRRYGVQAPPALPGPLDPPPRRGEGAAQAAERPRRRPPPPRAAVAGALQQWASGVMGFTNRTSATELLDAVHELHDLTRGKFKPTPEELIDLKRPIPLLADLCGKIKLQAHFWRPEKCLELLQALARIRKQDGLMQEVLTREHPTFFSAPTKPPFKAIVALIASICTSATKALDRARPPPPTRGAAAAFERLPAEQQLTYIMLCAKSISALNICPERQVKRLNDLVLRALQPPESSPHPTLTVSRLAQIAGAFAPLRVSQAALFDVIKVHTPAAIGRLQRAIAETNRTPPHCDQERLLDEFHRTAAALRLTEPAGGVDSRLAAWRRIWLTARVMLYAPIPRDPLQDVDVVGCADSEFMLRLHPPRPRLVQRADGGAERRARGSAARRPCRLVLEGGFGGRGGAAAQLMHALRMHEAAAAQRGRHCGSSTLRWPTLRGLDACIGSFYELLAALEPCDFNSSAARWLLKADVVIRGAVAARAQLQAQKGSRRDAGRARQQGQPEEVSGNGPSSSREGGQDSLLLASNAWSLDAVWSEEQREALKQKVKDANGTPTISRTQRAIADVLKEMMYSPELEWNHETTTLAVPMPVDIMVRGVDAAGREVTVLIEADGAPHYVNDERQTESTLPAEVATPDTIMRDLVLDMLVHEQGGKVISLPFMKWSELNKDGQLAHAACKMWLQRQLLDVGVVGPAPELPARKAEHG